MHPEPFLCPAILHSTAHSAHVLPSQPKTLTRTAEQQARSQKMHVQLEPKNEQHEQHKDESKMNDVVCETVPALVYYVLVTTWIQDMSS